MLVSSIQHSDLVFLQIILYYSNPEEVIRERGYEPLRDVENTPDSVFCAKGAGFTVPWDEAPGYMHCRPE